MKDRFLSAEDIALQLYPHNWVEVSSVKGLKIDNNAGKRAVAVEVARYFISLREGCVHNHGYGLCGDCLNDVDKF